MKTLSDVQNELGDKIIAYCKRQNIPPISCVDLIKIAHDSFTTSLKELLEQVLPEKQEGYSLEGDRYEVCRQEVEDRIKKILSN